MLWGITDTKYSCSRVNSWLSAGSWLLTLTWWLHCDEKTTQSEPSIIILTERTNNHDQLGYNFLLLLPSIDLSLHWFTIIIWGLRRPAPFFFSYLLLGKSISSSQFIDSCLPCSSTKNIKDLRSGLWFLQFNVKFLWSEAQYSFLWNQINQGDRSRIWTCHRQVFYMRCVLCDIVIAVTSKK